MVSRQEKKKKVQILRNKFIHSEREEKKCHLSYWSFKFLYLELMSVMLQVTS